MLISDWSSDVCSSDLIGCWRCGRSRTVSGSGLRGVGGVAPTPAPSTVAGNQNRIAAAQLHLHAGRSPRAAVPGAGQLLGVLKRHQRGRVGRLVARSEEHTSELQSLMRIPYAVVCLKKKKT